MNSNGDITNTINNDLSSFMIGYNKKDKILYDKDDEEEYENINNSSNDKLNET